MPDPNPTSMELALKTICLTLMAYVLPAADGDPAKASALIADMVHAYAPADLVEMDLAGRLVGFSLGAMDSMRLSIADPDLPAAQILRHRTTAAGLSRSAEKCRAALNARRSAAQPEPPAKPRTAKPAAAKSRPAEPAPDIEREKAAARARGTLERLDRLHLEWASAPNGVPLLPRPATPDANKPTGDPA